MRIAHHGRRGAQLIAGLVGMATRDGLHTATMRAVAVEAGVSLGLVQYPRRHRARVEALPADAVPTEETSRNWRSAEPEDRRGMAALCIPRLPT